jgi:hypothetical protein
MMGGMESLVMTPRDTRMKGFPVSELVAETNRYSWGMVDAASHFGFTLAASNLRNQFNVSMEYGWNKISKVKLPEYLHDYLRFFGGVNIRKIVLIRLQ